MSITANSALVPPHGGRLVDRLVDVTPGVDSLERIVLSESEVSDLDMLACGALSPLEGFMGADDYQRVLAEMRLMNGLPWALPVCLAVERPPRAERAALADQRGRLLGVVDVDEVYDYDKRAEAERCFGTTGAEHPGVRRLYERPPLYLAGTVSVFARPAPAFVDLALSPSDTRRIF
jgi:sulfate adenylyltransferase